MGGRGEKMFKTEKFRSGRSVLRSSPVRDTGVARSHVVVVGGGFAGAAAASALAEAGVAVTLLEARPTLGGRTNSVRDGVTRQEIDNGPHLFLGAYRDTRTFLRRLKTENRLQFFPRLAVPFFNRNGQRSVLQPGWGPGSLGFLTGLLGFPEFSFRDKMSLLLGLTRLRGGGGKIGRSGTVDQWLSSLKQRPGTRRAFWDPLCYATLNERADLASAEALWAVLREGFFTTAENRAFGFSTVPLGRLWAVELPAYLKNQGGHVSAHLRATGIRVEGDRALAVEVAGESPVTADAVVLAVPPWEFLKVAPPSVTSAWKEWAPPAPSPIAAIHMWFKTPPFDEPLAGFLDMDIQWGFHREKIWGSSGAGQFSFVMSAARGHTGHTSEELAALVLGDLRRAVPGFKEAPHHVSVTWEKSATPSPTPDFWKGRPGVETPIKNLFLAGDWVDVGLPPTIESACRSGHRAAARAVALLQTESAV